MPTRLSDAEIDELVKERKILPDGFRQKLIVKAKHGHKERELTVSGGTGRTFRIILRESNFNAMDFSAILVYLPHETNIPFRLRRYNGKSHEHTNKIEKETFYDFHIHMATERYQQVGEEKEDAYAMVTDRYGDLQEALNCLIKDCGFALPQGGERDIFEEMN